TSAWGGSMGSLTVKLEGARVLEDYQLPVAPDADHFPADVKEVGATVSDGNGLQLEATGSGSAPALAGLEIWDEGLPPVSVLSPNGGESFSVGDTLVVKWEADALVTSVGIQVSVDSGAKWLPLTRTRSVAPSDADWGDFKWVIPDSLDGVPMASGKVLVSVYDYFGADRDRSDSAFTIATAAVAVKARRASASLRLASLGGGNLRVSLPGSGPFAASLSDTRGRRLRAWSWGGAGDRVLSLG